MSKITYTPEPPITYTPWLIGCVQHDCNKCKARDAELRRLEEENVERRQENKRLIKQYRARIDDMKELLEALKAVQEADNPIIRRDVVAKVDKARELYRAALNKHGGQS